jgi:hypothetical protein
LILAYFGIADINREQVMFKSFRLVLLTVIFSQPACHLLAAENVPDFSGVWVAYASEPAFVRTDAQTLTPEGQALQEAYMSQYPNWVEPGAWCVPPGMPSTMTSLVAYPIEIIQKDNQITLLAELEMQVRRVFLDGRDHPDDYPTTRMGHSIGYWDKDTLVIHTALLKETLDGRWPRTEKMEITERVSLTTRAEAGVESSGFVATIAPPINNDTLVFELTVNDPALYREPRTVTVYYQRMSDDIFLEYDCAVDKWQEALEAANQ